MTCVQEAEMSEESEDDTPAISSLLEKKTPEKHVKVKKQAQVQFKWIGEGTKSGKKTYYEGNTFLFILHRDQDYLDNVLVMKNTT